MTFFDDKSLKHSKAKTLKKKKSTNKQIVYWRIIKTLKTQMFLRAFVYIYLIHYSFSFFAISQNMSMYENLVNVSLYFHLWKQLQTIFIFNVKIVKTISNLQSRNTFNSRLIACYKLSITSIKKIPRKFYG